MADTIPIFPLNTVLFPGAPLPLRIFEPRYRQMLAYCMENDQRFGVNLIRSGLEVGGNAEPHMVGTIADITSVRDEDGGSIPINTRGDRRYRITSIDSSGPYLVGEIEFLEDIIDDAAEAESHKARDIAASYIRMLLTTQGEWHRVLELPSEPLRLSYFLGTVLLGLSGSVRQEILETDPVSARLSKASEALVIAANEMEKTIMRSGPGKGRTVFGKN
ncbi:MAG: LON peptidase substrate-binding domain-containing protein [Chloroflexi bacterium]|nr:LON peptidase substrate-binding domain-containing protein [Chloroflexota bacterium]